MTFAHINLNNRDRPCASCVRKGYECVERACKACLREGKTTDCTHRRVQDNGIPDAGQSISTMCIAYSLTPHVDEAAEATKDHIQASSSNVPGQSHPHPQPPVLQLPAQAHPHLPPPLQPHPTYSNINNISAFHFYYSHQHQQQILGPGHHPPMTILPQMQPQMYHGTGYFPIIDPSINNSSGTLGSSGHTTHPAS